MSVKLGPKELEAIRNNIENHDGLQRYLKAGFESNGWDVLTELRPDHSNLRIDMLLIEGDCRIGVELKYLYPGDGLTKVGKAVKKIHEQYANKKYFGETVDLWAIGIYGKHFTPDARKIDDEYGDGLGRGKREATQHLLNAQNIGHIQTYKPYVGILFSNGDRKQVVAGFAAEDHVGEWYDQEIEVDVLREKTGLSS